METTKKQTPELLKNLDGTVEDFTAQHENGDLKAVGLGGKYCDNDTAHLIVSEIGGIIALSGFHKYFADTLENFMSDLGRDLKNACFYDAIEFSEGSVFDLNQCQNVITASFGDIIEIFKNANVLSDFILGDKPSKQTLISHIISILSQKDVDCIDLVGLDSDLLEHIESTFEEETICFEDEENEEVYKGRIIHKEEDKAIVMIDEVICCVESEIEYNDIDDQPVYGWTW